ncbi:hypothetical protein AFM18_18905 [Achromobacter spanius]|uniref:Uncharacterized protein n=1 Tax=Achromobacter spanius TaxID=217203 RepID=A0AAW3I1P6_9BURK|nr:hypothetical protein AFM18_18905 [Achromobacter spanius]
MLGEHSISLFSKGDRRVDRLVDVIEELMKFTLLTRAVAPYLVDRDTEARRLPPLRLHGRDSTRYRSAD